MPYIKLTSALTMIEHIKTIRNPPKAYKTPFFVLFFCSSPKGNTSRAPRNTSEPIASIEVNICIRLKMVCMRSRKSLHCSTPKFVFSDPTAPVGLQFLKSPMGSQLYPQLAYIISLPREQKNMINKDVMNSIFCNMAYKSRSKITRIAKKDKGMIANHIITYINVLTVVLSSSSDHFPQSNFAPMYRSMITAVIPTHQKRSVCTS